jgi:hypothetical protein
MLMRADYSGDLEIADYYIILNLKLTPFYH